MELIIDREFLNNFFVSYDEKNPYHIDIKKFFRQLKGYKLIINCAGQEDFEELVRLNPLLEFMIENLPVVEYDPHFHCLDEEIINSTDNFPFKLFFIDKQPVGFKSSMNDNGYECITTLNIEEHWKSYFSQREDKTMQVTDNKNVTECRFDSWNQLCNFQHPLHSIVIFDRYALINNFNQKLEDNLFGFFRTVQKGFRVAKNIQITIITEKLYADIKSVHEDILQILEELFKNENVGLNIILHDKSYYLLHSEQIAFRRIYTNYFIIKSDKGINIFRSNGRVFQHGDIQFEFIFNNRNWQHFCGDMHLIRNYINKVENRPAIGYAKEIINYYPGKTNKLFTKLN